VSISSLARRAGKVTANNAPAILTAIGVTGAITTAVLAGKASFKAAEVIAREQARHDLEEQSHPFDIKEKAELTWKLFVPAVGTGVLTVAAIVMSNRISTRRAAALASAYTVSQEFFKEYKKAVVDKIGEEKEKEVREDVARKVFEKNPPPVIVSAAQNGKCWIHDVYSEQMILSSPIELDRAVNEINFQIINNGSATLSDFYNELGATHGNFAREIGWSSPNKLELDIGTTRDPDGMPLLTLDFRTEPVREHGSHY
jgi:hypothetical protein